MKRKDELYSLVKELRALNVNESFLRSFRRDLLNYTFSHPVLQKEKHSFFASIFSFRLIPLTLIAALILSFSGGITVFASQKSLPGDTLYPIKIISENVRVSLISPGAPKANFRIEQAYKRIKEIKKIQERSDNKKTANALIKQTSRHFNSHIDDAINQIHDLRDKGQLTEASQIRQKLTLSLGVYREIVNDKKKEDDDIQKKVENEEEEINKKEEESKKFFTNEKAQEKLDLVSHKIEDVKRLIIQKKSNLSNDILEKAEKEVTSADEKFRDAREKFNKGDISNMYDKTQEALELVARARSLMESAALLDNTTLETILPRLDDGIEKEKTITKERAREEEDKRDSHGEHNKEKKRNHKEKEKNKND